MKKHIVRMNFPEGVGILSLNEKEFEHFKKFNENYELENQLNSNEEITLGEKKYTCRFCNKSKPEVTFKKQAHVISRQFENSTPKSHFECDTCNDTFAKYENDLSNYFLLDRTLLGISRKRKKGTIYPAIKNNSGTRIYVDEKMESLNDDDPKQSSLKAFIKKEGLTLVNIYQDLEGIEITYEGNKVHYSLKRQPYRPINIYRSLLKMALCLLDKNELGNYTLALKLLQDKNLITNIPIPIEVYTILFSYIPIYKNLFNPVSIRLYKCKEDKKGMVSDKIFVLYFGNRIVQIPVLSDSNIAQLHKKENVKFHRIPEILNPKLGKELINNSELMHAMYDAQKWANNFSSIEVKREDVQKLTVSQENDFTEL